MDSVRAEIRVHLAVYIPFRIYLIFIVWSEDTDLDGIFVKVVSFSGARVLCTLSNFHSRQANINLIKITVEYSIPIFAKQYFLRIAFQQQF